MKKILLVTLSLFTLLFFATQSNAQPNPKAFFMNAKKSAPKMVGSVGGAYPLTDIIIYNDSYDGVNITAANPYGYYSDYIYARDYLHFIDYSWGGLTEIILSDSYGYVFFDRYVDNHATIVVSDPYGMAATGDKHGHLTATVK